ncbi:hypothetical protein F5B22DRAFT_658101 [Xylaria bambusicola]|uniref:uncharacterized protein n=1 Tax=Xylaria bambusicola TaxID=326684 RepID=UPI002007B26B|nr:uncharacterized protein F5B22DRAFT_658101 [Xylaria bambusicola]KAI0509538.1 hypothetical protein F5B22DRAFT_658101 [Xylaria bambusicola]
MDPIAVIGYGVKLPQAIDDDIELWKTLKNAQNVMTDWPESRATIDSFHDPSHVKINMLYGRGAHFLKDDPAVFDAPFFSITSNEAIAMDPQQRWVLETAYHAFENAGIPIQSLRGSNTAVFGASMSDDYSRILSKDPDMAPRMAATGIEPSCLPNRVSWYFHLRGPSVLINTACSGSLIALDQACQSMHCGDSSMALVFGSSMLLSPESSLMLANMNFLSPDSKCYSFDHRANGYGRGEGVVAMVLKPLRQALRDGDMIRGVLRATGANQDGRTPGLTQPSAEAQELLIRHTYSKAGLSFKETRYIEAHGTGTPTGDPIEMKAIGKVFRNSRSANEPLLVGSIKANIGHLEGASGLAGLLKTILVLEKGIIPPNALFEKLNPAIDAEFYHLAIPTKSTPWPTSGVRRASVNSFGFGGSNAHVIVDDARSYLRDNYLLGYHNCTSQDADDVTIRSDSYCDQSQASTIQLLVWSAADRAAIGRVLELAQNYYKDSVSGNWNQLNRLAYTLAVRRSHLPWRSFAIMSDIDASSQDSMLLHSKPIRASSKRLGIALVFSGQGAQYPRMGEGLLAYPIYKRTLDRADTVFSGLGCPFSLFDVLEDEKRIYYPEVSQPLCTAIQLALVELLQSFGVKPTAVAGHSSGEIAAAYTVGALSFESACKVAYYRGKFAQILKGQAQRGAMLAVNLTTHNVQNYLNSTEGLAPGSVHIACVNSPLSHTLSGDEEAIEKIKTRLDHEGIFAQKLNTGVAYHSPAMGVISHQYLCHMGSLSTGSLNNRITVVSSVTGAVVAPEAMSTAKYWVDNLVSPVQFADAVVAMLNPTNLKVGADAVTDVLEVGPHATLRRPVLDIVSAVAAEEPVQYHSTLHRSKPALQSSINVMGHLFCQGYPVLVDVINGRGPTSRMVPLVECPLYPFDHSRRYWAESRLSRDFRLRSPSVGYLLGRPSHDWNALRPTFRNWLSVESTPWLGDHVISGLTICPGAGMIVMAIEAVQWVQGLSLRASDIAGFLINKAVFISPIQIAKDALNPTETYLYLQQADKRGEERSDRYTVSLFSYHDAQWAECFHAEVQVQYNEKTASPIDGGRESQLKSKRVLDAYKDAEASSSVSIHSELFYDFLRGKGLHYGQSFRLLRNIHWDTHDTSTASIAVPAVSNCVRGSPVHPAQLDAAVHLILAQVSQGMTSKMPTLVPQQLTNAWISATPWNTVDGSRVDVVSVVQQKTIRGIQGSIAVLAPDGNPLLSVEEMAMVPVSGIDDVDAVDSRSEPRKIYQIQWKQQLSSLNPVELQYSSDVTDSAPPAIHSPGLDMESINSFMFKAAKHAVHVSCREDGKGTALPPHLHRFRRYMQQISNLDLYQDIDDWEQTASCFAQVAQASPAMRLFASVGQNLPLILDGKFNALELIFSADVERFYDGVFTELCDHRFKNFIELASHENPGLRILEVGAGTGGMTHQVLSALHEQEQRTGCPSFVNYTYTDISPVFFETAKSKFSSFIDRLVFKKLDLEQNPSNQGFEAGGYDLVIAGSVLHATTRLEATLARVRSLLRSGGHLVMIEITSTASLWANLCWGALPGWWLSEESWRQDGPLVDQDTWNKLLLQAGFSGLEMNFGLEYGVSFLTSKAIKLEKVSAISSFGPADRRLVLLITRSSDEQVAVADSISEKRNNTKIFFIDCLLDELTTDSDMVVSLLEIGNSSLAALTEYHFLALQKLMIAVQDLLWVSTSTPMAENSPIPCPYEGISTGLLRVLRSEHPTKHIVSLVIEPARDDTCAKAWGPTMLESYIKQIMRKCFEGLEQSADSEFIVRNGRLHIGRLAHVADLEDEVRSYIKPRVMNEPWGQGPALSLMASTPGLIDTLRFVEDIQHKKLIGPQEVEIKAKAWPISFRDVFIALGRLGTEGLGFECAGTVTRAGADTDFQPGERVCMVVPGCMRTYPRAHARSVFRIPDTMSFDDVVAALNPGMTAYQALVNTARIKRSDKVLIHSAAGSTGQMAIWLAKQVGAEIFATVGHEQKKQLLMNTFAIPDNHIFYSRDTSFAAGIMRVTNGYGVDVVLNSLSGDKLQATWSCIAPYGRFIEIGKMDIKNNASLPMAYFAKNVSFSAIDLYHIAQTDHELTHDLAQAIINIVARGKAACPQPLHTYSITNIEQAFRFMQSGRNTGRIMIHVKPEHLVTKFITKKATWRLDPSAVYVVSGGLGGLGREICRWMCARGARKLLVPSRSGASSQGAASLVAELERNNIDIKISKCDVGSPDDLAALLQECENEGFAPIKGCINASMALHDAVFESMTHDQWDTTIRSKVSSSWNLHSQLPHDLDFFVLLSSLAGIYGSLAQSNYAAGCTFQDALAHSRTVHGIGKTSVSLDLGWVRDVGIVAEHEEYRLNRSHARDMKPIDAAEVLALLDIYCDPEAAPQKPYVAHSQVLLGAVTPLDTYREGRPPAVFETNPLFSGFVAATNLEKKSTGLSVSADGDDTRMLFQQATEASVRMGIVERALKGNLARALAVSIEEVDSHRPLSHSGVDSLVALELRNWIRHDFQATVAVFEIMNNETSVMALSKMVVERTENRG